MFDTPPAIIQVEADPGGSIAARAAQIEQIRRSGAQVRIVGRCNSACTMYLGLPRSQVCVAPGARLGFHSAYYWPSQRFPAPEATAQMMGYYPDFVRARLQPLTSKMQYMTGASLLPFMRRC